jgi:hypothetical protein
MLSHVSYGPAVVIRKQAEDIVVLRALSGSQRLGYGLLRYVFHDFALSNESARASQRKRRIPAEAGPSRLAAA